VPQRAVLARSELCLDARVEHLAVLAVDLDEDPCLDRCPEQCGQPRIVHPEVVDQEALARRDTQVRERR
jgi:hypothetical protein